MAKKYKFKGLKKPSFVDVMGPILAFIFKTKDGRSVRVDAPDQVQGFKAGDVIDIPDDPRVTRHCRKDPKFEEQ